MNSADDTTVSSFIYETEQGIYILSLARSFNVLHTSTSCCIYRLTFTMFIAMRNMYIHANRNLFLNYYRGKIKRCVFVIRVISRRMSKNKAFYVQSGVCVCTYDCILDKKFQFTTVYPRAKSLLTDTDPCWHACEVTMRFNAGNHFLCGIAAI